MVNFYDMLEEANKYIFVQQYNIAEKIVDGILSDPQGRLFMLAHLRRIELAVRNRTVERLRRVYIQARDDGSLPLEIVEIAIASLDQHAELVPPRESINVFTDIIKKHGESAAAYYGIGMSFEQQQAFDRSIYNYLQSVRLDSDWYPSYFGLSQVYYAVHNLSQGDNYFYLFEQKAPYNLYGNIETHNRLYRYFLEKNYFTEAERAVTALPQWWADTRSFCPKEIQIYKSLALGELFSIKNESSKSSEELAAASRLTDSLIASSHTKKEELFFVAQLHEDFKKLDVSLKLLKAILDRSPDNLEVIEKIGKHYVAIGKVNEAEELFLETYKKHPENAAIRVSLLLARLHRAGIDSESYLQLKERVMHTMGTSDIVTVEPLINHLISQFDGDPDIHQLYGEFYIHAGNIDKSAEHFRKMYHLDNLNTTTRLKYASFLINFSDLEQGAKILRDIPDSKTNPAATAELSWLYSIYNLKKDERKQALGAISAAIRLEPWNYTFIEQEILIREALPKAEQRRELDYVRAKRAAMVASSDRQSIQSLVLAGTSYDPKLAFKELLKLINTNVDSPWITWGLGTLQREMGHCEAATTWWELLLDSDTLPDELKSQVYLDLSDCYVWKNVNLEKSIEYSKMIHEDSTHGHQAFLIMAHAFLKLGKIKNASDCLEQAHGSSPNFESTFLTGLLHYRNGALDKARSIWKPLLTVKAEKIKDHWIKRDILDFYFNDKSYPYMG